MSTQTTELENFHRFVLEKLNAGESGLSPEEALDQWRLDHPAQEEFVATVAALREALADMQAGDTGKPLDEFDREFRARHGLPPAP